MSAHSFRASLPGAVSFLNHKSEDTMHQLSKRRPVTSGLNHHKIEWVTDDVKLATLSRVRISKESAGKLLAKFAPYYMSADAVLNFQRMLRITGREWMR